MTLLKTQELIDLISSQQNIPFRLEAEITNRRGARLLKLSADGGFFTLKIGSEVNGAVAHESSVSQQLRDFNYQIYMAHGEFAKSAWLLQTWVEGGGVHKRVRQIQEQSGNGVKSELLNLFGRMFVKVADLHALGFLHGDIQPAHFKLSESSEAMYLLDYGLAHRIDSKFVYPGAFVHFSAPEICTNQLNNQPAIYDQRAELYSLASTVFFLYTGQMSVDYGKRGGDKASLQDSRASIAAGNRNSFEKAGCRPFDELEAILEKCLAFDPAKRYLTVADAAGAFKQAI